MAKVPQVFGFVGASFGTDRRQVVEDDRQLLIDQRPQERCQSVVNPVGTLRQGIHRAQQVLVGDRIGADLGNPGALQPAQDPQLGLRITPSATRSCLKRWSPTRPGGFAANSRLASPERPLLKLPARSPPKLSVCQAQD
jgi:hypothetical protein